MTDLKEKLAGPLAAYGVTDPELLESFAQRSSLVTFHKDQNLVLANDHPKHFGFITKGLFRYYYIGTEGKERNKSFFMEGHPVGSLSAIITGEPSPYTIEALEDSEVILIPVSQIEPMQEQHPLFKEFFHAVTRTMFLRNERREAMLLTLSAEQRYQWLLEKEPELAQRVPQYHLASYMGMDAVSLSRIKRKLKS